ncbi:pilus assembly protein PilM [bacterium]|nr:pilus assembly protein PilM [bacterium]
MGLFDSIFGKKMVTSVGIDIGSFSSKLVKIEFPPKGEPTVEGLAVRRYPSRSISDKEIREREVLIGVIQELVDAVDPEITEVIASISGHKVMTDIFMVTRPKGKVKLDELVLTEAESHIPTGTDGVSLSYEVLEEIDEGRRLRILLTAAKGDYVESYVDLLDGAGLTPIIIDVDYFALYNVFTYNYEVPEKGIYFLVNVGYELTNIAIIVDQKLFTVRDISMGAKDIWSRIQSELRLSNEEVSRIISGETGWLDETSLRGAIFIASDDVKVGLDMVYSFLEKSLEGRGVDKYYFSGGGSLIPFFMEAMKEKLPTEVEILDPFQKIICEPFFFGEKKKDEVAPLYAIATGLALRQG